MPNTVFTPFANKDATTTSPPLIWLGTYESPALARLMARRGHNLVLGDPLPGLIEDVEALGASLVSRADMAEL
jgi:hypothetical protein